jgi:hypothetical protein
MRASKRSAILVDAPLHVRLIRRPSFGKVTQELCRTRRSRVPFGGCAGEARARKREPRSHTRSEQPRQFIVVYLHLRG